MRMEVSTNQKLGEKCVYKEGEMCWLLSLFARVWKMIRPGWGGSRPEVAKVYSHSLLKYRSTDTCVKKDSGKSRSTDSTPLLK